MEYVTPRKVTNRKGVLCGPAPIMTTCDGRGIVGGGVFCLVRPDAKLQEPTGQASQSREISREW
jgi:hypothetical protein